MIRSLRLLLMSVAFGLLAAGSAAAQTGKPVFGLGARNAAAHERGAEFRELRLFLPTEARELHTEIVSAETQLLLDRSELDQLLQDRPEGIRLDLRSAKGEEYHLELLRAAPLPANAELGYIDATGRHRSGSDLGVHYQGIVTGSERSMASLSAFPNGDVMVLFANDEGNFNLGKLQDGSGRFILYNDKDLKARPDAVCATEELADAGKLGLDGSLKTSQAKVCNRVRVYWEITNNVYEATKSAGPNPLTGTMNYVTGLFNEVATMYFNENIEMEMSSMYIWITPDFYNQNTSSTALNGFRQYWNLHNNNFNGDMAHLITRANNGNGGGNGGLAYVNVLCNRSIAYAYSDIYGSVLPVPRFSWDVEVVTHETGHNLGSNHTHWCGWNTGAGGTCGAIDNCYNLESGSGCSTCSSTLSNSASTSAWRGSVMSYCHLVTRGINLANGFLAQPGNTIRTAVSGASCLQPLLKAKLVTTPICNSNDGRIDVVLEPDNGGTAPYRYRWGNRDTTSALTNLGNPGIFSMNLLDSNNCVVNLVTTLQRNLNPGDGQPVSPAIRMPICCGPARQPLALHSNTDMIPTACQSIYWLRTNTPITNLADARARFDTATTTVFPSKTINTGGAWLDVTPPASCANPVTWYFTPVSVNVARTRDSFETSSSTNASFNSANSVRLGSRVSLGSQLTQPVLCHPSDTPDISNLTINISSYTGRPDYLTILIRNSADVVIYQRSGLPGNGTYVLTQDSLGDYDMLGAMTVYAYDYNCTSTTACTGSNNTISLSRKVRYPARKASMDAGCRLGASIHTSFADGGCTQLSVSNINAAEIWHASLAPNPATSRVQLSYIADGNALSLDITDVLGKRISGQSLPAGNGPVVKSIDVQGWAKGVYFFNLYNQRGLSQRMKLVVE